MISIQKRGARWQLRVNHKLLPKPFFSTFEAEDEARAYGTRLNSLLDRGVLPAELMDAEQKGEDPVLARVIGDYERAVAIAPSDAPMIKKLRTAVGTVRLSNVTASWADSWVKDMAHLAPGTIRKHVDSLARVMDWYWRSLEVKTPVANPLRMMPKGYSAGASTKRDVERNRRLSPEEVERCVAALSGVKREDRKRALPVDPEFALLFQLILGTGMRLSEAYTLRVNQVNTTKWVLAIDGSKGHRGALKPRVIPVIPALRPLLAAQCQGRKGLVFGFWDGTPENKKLTTGRLSQRFATLFDYAGAPDITEHDLRHCATCSWFELRRPDGAWVFSEIEVCRIMGWSDTSMVLRYASLRGEDLSSRLV